MGKISREPQPFVYPLPVALVTCLEPGGGANIVTVSWVSNVCASPPLVAISLRPHRYSTQIIQETGEFAVNIPSYHIAYEVDLCGTLSGKDVDKLRIAGLTEMPAEQIRAPLVAECPVNMECRTHQVIPLGSHVLFLGKIVALHVEEDICFCVEDGEMEEQEKVVELTRAKPLIYNPETHDYWIMGDIAQNYNRSGGKKP